MAVVMAVVMVAAFSDRYQQVELIYWMCHFLGVDSESNRFYRLGTKVDKGRVREPKCINSFFTDSLTGLLKRSQRVCEYSEQKETGHTGGLHRPRISQIRKTYTPPSFYTN